MDEIQSCALRPQKDDSTTAVPPRDTKKSNESYFDDSYEGQRNLNCKRRLLWLGDSNMHDIRARLADCILSPDFILLS